MDNEELCSDRLKKIIKINYDELKAWATVIKRECPPVRHISAIKTIANTNHRNISLTCIKQSYTTLNSRHPTPKNRINHIKVPMISKYKNIRRSNKCVSSFVDMSNLKKTKCFSQKEIVLPHQKMSFIVSSRNANESSNSQLNKVNSSYNIPNFLIKLKTSSLINRKAYISDEFKSKFINMTIKQDIGVIKNKKLLQPNIELTIFEKERIKKYLNIIKYEDHWTQKYLQLKDKGQ